MALLTVNLSEFEGDFCCSKLCNTYNSYIKHDSIRYVCT